MTLGAGPGSRIVYVWIATVNGIRWQIVEHNSHNFISRLKQIEVKSKYVQNQMAYTFWKMCVSHILILIIMFVIPKWTKLGKFICWMFGHISPHTHKVFYWQISYLVFPHVFSKLHKTVFPLKTSKNWVADGYAPRAEQVALCFPMFFFKLQNTDFAGEVQKNWVTDGYAPRAEQFTLFLMFFFCTTFFLKTSKHLSCRWIRSYSRTCYLLSSHGFLQTA